LNSKNEMFEYVELTKNVISMVPSKPMSKINDASETVPTTCIALPKELVFVDCGAYPDLVRKFRLDMESKFQRKTSNLIFTHTHWDHVIAMEVFKDVNVVASEMGIQGIKILINRINEKGLEECKKDFDVQKDLAEIIINTKLFVPNIKVKDDFRIKSGETELIFQVIGGHSIDSAHIYVPKEQILCAGDNLIECYAQLLGNPDESLKIFRNWESLEISKIIPGHGKIVGKEYITKARKYYEDLIFVLEEFSTQKLTIKEVLNHPDLPEYFGKNQSNWMEGIRPNSNWIDNVVRSWYRYIKQKSKTKD